MPTSPSLSKLTAFVTVISIPLFAAPQITEFVAINANSQFRRLRVGADLDSGI